MGKKTGQFEKRPMLPLKMMMTPDKKTTTNDKTPQQLTVDYRYYHIYCTFNIPPFSNRFPIINSIYYSVVD